jgi:hypothetical protein
VSQTQEARLFFIFVWVIVSQIVGNRG